jgi:hypothetical protein
MGGDSGSIRELAAAGLGKAITYAAVFCEMQFSHLRRVISRGVSATIVGANAKHARKRPQINRRFFVAIPAFRNATPTATAIMETGIKASVPKPSAHLPLE